MIRSPISSWTLTCCLAALFALAGCAADGTSSESTGSLGLSLELAPGVVINEVDWTISSPGMDDMTGTIDTSAPGATASVEVYGLPPGGDYLVALEATDETGEITCRGSAPFSVEVGVSTDIMVMLNCKVPSRLGGVRVNGKFNICTELTKVIVSPLQTSVGSDIDLFATGEDAEGDPITYAWSATGGTIDDSSAPVTTYTCGEVGQQEITILVTDNDVYCDMATWTVAVTCVEGDNLCEGVTCEDDGNECTAAACNPATGQCETSAVDDGNECDGGAGQCMGGECVAIDLCDGVDCDDGNECTSDVCDPSTGECSNDPVDNGTACDGGAGMCVDGTCMVIDLCEGVTCDDTGNECTVAQCNTQNGECEEMNVPDGADCDGDAGMCMSGACVPNDLCEGVICEDDGNECTVAECNAETGLCETSNVADGTDCDGGAGTCMAGVCESATIACLYEQDFETFTAGDPPQPVPNSLSEDGWLVGANVFAPDGTSFLYNYFAFPAPNGGPAFSAVAVGEGGPGQGDQQLSIYNDYNNADHGVGNIIEAIVFQEFPIVADDVGTTIVLTFDAKKGNIVPPTTASAFVKTIAGSDTTNALFVDTTNLPDTWDTFTISLPIVQGLVGQVLQIGFQSRATNFDSSGIFYDNLTLGVEGCGGDNGGGGPSGELTTNGDFEAGDTSGWEFFPNDGNFAATMAENNGGLWSGNLVASVPAGGGPPSFPVVKQANIGIGTVQPNSTATISFDLFGSVSGAGGVFFAEFFSELSGGGTSSSVILGGGPLFPNGSWTNYTFNTPTGNDVSGGVTLQLKADCGANPGCTVDAFIDNVSVSTP